MNRQPVAALLLMAAFTGSLITAAPSATAEDPWRPFGERSSRSAQQPADRYPPWGREQPPGDAPWSSSPSSSRVEMAPLLAPVERSELAPVMSNDGSGLPFDSWTGLDINAAEQLMSGLTLPSPSPALSGLWQRLLTSGSGPAGSSPQQYLAIQAEGLYRSGQLKPLGEVLSRAGAAISDPLVAAQSARYDVAVGRRENGCSAVRTSAAHKQDLPPPLRSEMLVLAGYCAAAAGNASAASLAAELAREEGLKDSALLDVLDAIAAGRPPRPMRSGRMTPTHYRLLQLAKGAEPAMVIEHADAALLAALVLDTTTEERLRVAAAEGAARLNAIAPDDLADVYRALRAPPRDLTDPLGPGVDPLIRRALLFQAAEADRHPERRARLLRALLDDARQSGFYYHALAAIAPLTEAMPRSPDFAWFGETAIEAALAAGKYDIARAWGGALEAGMRGGGRLEHWLALADIANADQRSPRGLHLPAVEQLALRGTFSAPVLHRLATALDALDYQVPMALWHAASSTPQPNDGFLPETGVLTELHEASTRKEFARTVLLAMRALGPKGAEDTHIIALGDTIRALRRVGLEADARRIAFEALFGAWPRSASH